MKTFDRKDVYSWSNAEEAKQYIEKKGYFADSIVGLNSAIRNKKLYELAEVSNTDADMIDRVFRPFDSEMGFGLFLPIDKAKEDEKKYRPFKNTDEFRDYLGFNFIVNLSIKIEEKITSERYELAIIGFFKNGLVLPIYCDLTFEELFRKFNICIDDKWQPFGVKE